MELAGNRHLRETRFAPRLAARLRSRLNLHRPVRLALGIGLIEYEEGAPIPPFVSAANAMARVE